MAEDPEEQLQEYQAKVQELGWEDAWDWAEGQGYSRQQIRELERETIHRRDMEQLGMWLDHLEERFRLRHGEGMIKRIEWRGRDYLPKEEHDCIGPDCPGLRGGAGQIEMPFELIADPDISASAARAYGVLSYFADPQSREAHVPYSVIAAILDRREGAIGPYMAELRDGGYIEKVERQSRFPRPPTYRLVLG